MESVPEPLPPPWGEGWVPFSASHFPLSVDGVNRCLLHQERAGILTPLLNIALSKYLRGNS